MYRKYFVYIDDGENVFRIAVAAVCEEAAMGFCEGNGEIVAVRDVTDDFPIDVGKVRSALSNAGCGEPEMDFICRSLVEFRIAE